ncbi:ATP-dependent Clp protease ATP-binding subunit ClpC [Lipingzhangella halophila]|uniref:ATP-dependent Clp protease ATP-binding subunit ClpC n=1 Tax=Lipingzhangella halophila TaxID=1783352 RepID=A0A7W7RJ91_9ACTN|nr:AAA family ATPase [Lipingzhangella halophila]MBB4932945.1 ATP-dependent Clp protease ATP-binding subunit ClpC [Lipingzhangella halophila]
MTAELGNILGVPEQCFDPDLLAATRRFDAAAEAAIATRDAAVSPVHVLIALARIDGGLTSSLFAHARIPINALTDALASDNANLHRELTGTSLTSDTASAVTQTVFKRLQLDHPEGVAVLDERRVLHGVLTALDERACDLLVRYGRVDLDEWRSEAATAPPEPIDPFRDGDRVDPAAFSPGARDVLDLMRSEAAGLGLERYSTALLLHAMVTAPGDLVEQACQFFRYDLDALRTQTLLLVRGSGTAAPRAAPATDTCDDPLRAVLRKAARLSALRRSTAVSERDLLAALVASPHGLAAGFFRDTGVDTDRLLGYADEYYAERARQPEAPAAPPLAEAMDWFRGRLIGQHTTIERLAPHIERIKRSFARDFPPEDRPRGAFLFCGPSGTGKTITARLLAKVVYGAEADVMTFEMGQFNTREAINFFVGAPPGYVGFGQGRLTNALRDNPRRVFLFDEVEKADNRVLDALLRLLDEGKIGDPAGPVREAHDTVIVVTSNLGTTQFAELGRTQGAPEAATPASQVDQLLASLLGTQEPEANSGQVGPPHGIGTELRHTLQEFFRPEFLNRLDEVLLFAALGPTELRDIAVVELRRLGDRVRDRLGVELDWRDGAAEHIGAAAWRSRPEQAARGVRRCVDDLVPVVLRLLDEAEEAGRRVRRVRVSVEGQRLAVTADD